MHSQATALRAETQSNLSLLDADPDLAECIPVAEQAAARHAMVVPEVTLDPGQFGPAAVFAVGRDGFGALVVSGLITREISVNGRPVLRLLGPGDIFVDDSTPGAGLGSGGGTSVEAAQAWRASVRTRLAVLDDRVLLAVRRWPRLFRAICARLQQCHDVTLLQLAISHRPATEDRIMGLFELLAGSWGRVSSHGIVVPISLTHEAIGHMIGSRRPTVTLALGALAREGRLQRVGGRWLLAPTATQNEPGPAVEPRPPRASLASPAAGR